MDANQNPFTPAGQPASPSAGKRSVRWMLGLIIAALGAIGTVVAAATAPDVTDRVIRVYQGIGLSILALLIWWVFLSGTRLLVRLGVLLAAAGAVVLVSSFAVTSVTFDGDMTPRFRFVWDPPSPREQAAKWLAENAPTQTAPAIDSDATAGDASHDAPVAITADDWPRYAGVDGNRSIVEPPCNFDWKQNPPKELWRHPVGEGWSSFAVVGTRLYTQEQRGGLECVVCYDATSGTELWRHEDEARYATPQGGVGPRATPTVTDTAVFALGATGLLNALNPVTGQRHWQRNICTDSGSDVLEWGMSGSPLVYENMVIVDAGGILDKAVIAYDRTSGDIVWAGTNHKASYMAPRIETIAGTTTLLIFHGDGLAGLNPEDGHLLWEFPWTNQYKINVAQTMRFGDQIFLSSGYDSGCVMIDPTRLTNGQPAEVWKRNKSLKLKFNEAVQLGDYVYGLDDGILSCIAAKTGERLWKGGRYGFGQILLWSDKLIVQAEKGFVAVVNASPDKYSEVSRFDALTDRTWNMPVVNRGRLYVRNAAEAACFELLRE